MNRITQEEMNTIIEQHGHWLKRDCDGWESMRAVLDGKDISSLSLHNAQLSGASLNGACLKHTYLVDTKLCGASLIGAHLNSAHLNSARLDNANLMGAFLSGADLSYANLDYANLDYAQLNSAKLYKASFYRASIIGVFIEGTYIKEAINVPYIPTACPDSGSFIGWKKCRGDVIVKLLIPEDARRSSSTGRKCRCDKAVVLGFENFSGNPLDINRAQSRFNPSFFYDLGETVSVTDFCENRFKECGEGIHFFINRQEAVEYIF